MLIVVVTIVVRRLSLLEGRSIFQYSAAKEGWLGSIWLVAGVNFSYESLPGEYPEDVLTGT